MNKNNKNTEVILHGEAMCFHSQLPDGVKEIKPSNKEFHIIADSETTGNHHVIDAGAGIKFYEDDAGTCYMVNEKDTQVRCLIDNRHDAKPLEAGVWEFGIQKEYDHFEQNLRNVRD